MSQSTATALDPAGIDAFLESQSMGTLSLASGNDSYAVPVAFSYASDSGDIYFRLGYTPGSRKREFVETTDIATFVVAAQTADGWKSVVARGTLEHQNTVDELSRQPTPDDSVSPADRELKIPFFHVFDAPDERLFALVRLRVSELTGVVEGTR